MVLLIPDENMGTKMKFRYLNNIEPENNKAKEAHANYLLSMSQYFVKAFMFGTVLVFIAQFTNIVEMGIPHFFTYLFVVSFFMLVFGFIASLVFRNRAIELLNEIEASK